MNSRVGESIRAWGRWWGSNRRVVVPSCRRVLTEGLRFTSAVF
jgi:hypothetical protein